MLIISLLSSKKKVETQTWLGCQNLISFFNPTVELFTAVCEFQYHSLRVVTFPCSY